MALNRTASPSFSMMITPMMTMIHLHSTDLDTFQNTHQRVDESQTQTQIEIENDNNIDDTASARSFPNARLGGMMPTTTTTTLNPNPGPALHDWTAAADWMAVPVASSYDANNTFPTPTTTSNLNSTNGASSVTGTGVQDSEGEEAVVDVNMNVNVTDYLDIEIEDVTPFFIGNNNNDTSSSIPPPTAMSVAEDPSDEDVIGVTGRSSSAGTSDSGGDSSAATCAGRRSNPDPGQFANLHLGTHGDDYSAGNDFTCIDTAPLLLLPSASSSS
jgi:hypothetical protein